MRLTAIASITRFTAALALCAALATGLTAGDKLDAQTLAEWSSVGAAPVVGPDGITLPQGAQLFRTYPSGPLDIRLVSHPYFSDTPAGWAVLEVGFANLTFVRKPEGGGVVLLADSALALPFDLPLDADGRSRDPLDLALRYDPDDGVAVLTLNEAEFDVAVTAPSGPVELAVQSGDVRSWRLELLQVAVGEAGSAGDSANRGGGSGNRSEATPRLTPAEQARAKRDAANRAKEQFLERTDAAAEKTLTDANRNPRNSAEWHLESANGLVQMAFSLSRAGHPQKAVWLAQRALEHTVLAGNKAARKPDGAVLATTINELAGFIREKLLADHAGATMEYQKAVARHPEGGVKSLLDRLEQIESEAARKGGARHR